MHFSRARGLGTLKNHPIDCGYTCIDFGMKQLLDYPGNRQQRKNGFRADKLVPITLQNTEHRFHIKCSTQIHVYERSGFRPTNRAQDKVYSEGTF